MNDSSNMRDEGVHKKKELNRDDQNVKVIEVPRINEGAEIVAQFKNTVLMKRKMGYWWIMGRIG